MSSSMRFVISFFFGILLLPTTNGGFPTTLVLESIDSEEDMNHTEIITKDRARHEHLFRRRSTMHGPANLPLFGSFQKLGRYVTKVKLGNPAKEYVVSIDTGSDLTWVNCVSCSGCPLTSSFVNLSFFDPHRSSSASIVVSCSDDICKSDTQNLPCSSDSRCGYSISYADGTGISGYFVSDTFHFHTAIGNSTTAISSPNIIFGCSNHESGLITKITPIDGLLGLGHHPISVPSQLAARGITPNIFSHCLKAKGGGILVLGEIIEPGIVYTPLNLSEFNYNVNLLSISIGGKRVPIHPKVFATSPNRGTIIDSGSTRVHLADEAYEPFVTALLAAIPPSLSLYSMDGEPCFKISTRIRDVSLLVTLNFAGGASMVLKPEEYLVQDMTFRDVWCLGFSKNRLQFGHGTTILGDIVLKDKVIVYDLAHQRLGWVNYDCSSSINVSSVPLKTSSSSRHRLIPIATGGFILYFSMFAAFFVFVN